MERSIANLLVGQTLVGRYRIDEVIGRGGMSVVYRAVDERLGRPVAVKVISFPTASEDEQSELRERLRREAESAACIPPHPNVVQVYDHGTDPRLGVDFIAMELLAGRDLKSVLHDGRLPLTHALHILTEATEGIAAGHQAGIVHRDVKPSNIVVAGDPDAPSVKILDFGIAKALRAAADDDLTRTGQLPHSPAYASPEQLRMEATLTPASDVYQLGLVAYELLAGERAYGRADQERIREGRDPGVPARGEWLRVPAGIREVIERALAPRPEDRYPDALALCRALSAQARAATEPSVSVQRDDSTMLLGDPAPPPAPPPAAPRTPPPAGWRVPLPPGLASRRAGTVALASLALILVLWLVGRRPGDPAPADGAAPVAGATAGLEEEFRALQVEAAEQLAAAAPDAAATAAGQEVDAVVRDVYRAWAEGEVERLAAHYADEVRFYGSTLSRDEVERSRGESIVAYPQRDIQILRTAITFPEPERARVLVDKEWNFRGDGRRWVGAGRQELYLEPEDGRWRVVEERDLEVRREEID